MDYFQPDPKPKRIKATEAEWQALRKKIWTKQKGLCLKCHKWIPLHGTSVFDTAHLAHDKSKGAGGNDTEDNMKGIYCFNCHINIEHGIKSAKRR